MRRKQLGAILLAVTLVASLGAAAVGSSAAALDSSVDDHQDGSDAPPTNDTETADEVYLYDNGTAVLVYEEDHEDVDAPDDVETDADDANVSNVTGEFGVDGEHGLLHALFSGDFEEESEATGEASVRVTPEAIAASGDVTGDRPDELENLSVAVESERTRSTSSSSADVVMVVDRDALDDEEAEDLDAYESVEVSSNTTVTGSTYETDGSITTVESDGNESEGAETGAAPVDVDSASVTITETDGGYEMSVTEERTVAEFGAARWENRTDAEESLQSRYSALAMRLGGTASVDLTEHAFEEADDGYDVSLEYAVTFEGVKEQVSERLADQFAESGEYEFDEQEARRVADRIASLRFERVHYAIENDGDRTTMEWDLRIENYDEAVLGLVEVAESVDEVDDELADEYDNVSATIEARNDADLVQRSEWSFAYEQDDQHRRYEVHSETDAENWEAYVTELEERDLVDGVAETTVDFSAETDGEALSTAFEYEVERESWFNESVDSVLEAAEREYGERAPDGGAMAQPADDEFVEFVTGLRESEFEVAKASVSFEEDSFTAQSAARFGNLSSFEGYPIETDRGTVVDVYGETANGTTTTYVTVDGFVDDADEDAVHAHEYVDDDTEVHMPGEWEREFPSLDSQSVDAYLEEDEDDDSGLPVSLEVAALAAGAVALIAVVGGAVAVRRR